jgi:hypothetical protein
MDINEFFSLLWGIEMAIAENFSKSLRKRYEIISNRSQLLQGVADYSLSNYEIETRTLPSPDSTNPKPDFS